MPVAPVTNIRYGRRRWGKLVTDALLSCHLRSPNPPPVLAWRWSASAAKMTSPILCAVNLNTEMFEERSKAVFRKTRKKWLWFCETHARSILFYLFVETAIIFIRHTPILPGSGLYCKKRRERVKSWTHDRVLMPDRKKCSAWVTWMITRKAQLGRSDQSHLKQ